MAPCSSLTALKEMPYRDASFSRSRIMRHEWLIISARSHDAEAALSMVGLLLEPSDNAGFPGSFAASELRLRPETDVRVCIYGSCAHQVAEPPPHDCRAERRGRVSSCV